MPRTSRKRRTTCVKCKMCGSLVKHDSHEKKSSKDKIPGYFYDAEKQRYFKITNETRDKYNSQKKKKEPTFCEKCTTYKAIQERKRLNNSIVRQILSQQCKHRTPWNLRRDVLQSLVSSYHVKEKMDIELTHLDPCDFAVCQIEPDLKCQKVLTLYKTINAENQIVQFHQVERESKSKLTLVPGTAMMKKQAVTSLHWSPHPKTSEFFLMSLLGCDGKWGEGMLFHTNGVMQTFISRYPMNHHSVWTSAWCTNPFYDHIISMGASKMALTFDVNTRRRMLRFLSNTDVFAQDFATQSPVLFNGFRNGDIKSSDIRLTGSRVSCMFMAQDKPVTSLKLLRDEVYLMVSGMDDTIRRWDLRMSKIVQEYHGHCNTTTLGLSVFMDPSESLLFAAGEDSVTRVWSVSTGELVHTIPFPVDEQTNLSSIPALSYSDEWGGPGGLPGLMYGTNQVMRWYGT